MTGIQFFVMDEFTGQETGPFTFAEIQQMIQKHKLKKKDFVRRSDSPQWVKAGEMLVKVFDNIEVFEEQKKEQLKKKKTEVKLHRISERQAQKKQRATEHSRKVTENRGTLLHKIFGEKKPSPYWGFEQMRSIINVLIGFVAAFAIVAGIFLVGGSVYVQIGEHTHGQKMVADRAAELEKAKAEVKRLEKMVPPAAAFDLQMARLEVTQKRELHDIAVERQQTFGQRMLSVFIAIFKAIATLVTGFFTVALLVFWRNLIDWLIDMEAHAQS